MKHSQKAKRILGVCTFLVAVFTVIVLYRSTFRKTAELPYERIDMQQAIKYMSYEENFILADVSAAEDYNEYHIPGAVSIPLAVLEQVSKTVLPDPEQMIYICAKSEKDSRAGALRLCESGYRNITEIGSSLGYEQAYKEVESQNPIDELINTLNN